MLVCGVLSLDFAYNLYRHREERKQKLQAASPKGSKGFQFYMACFVIAFIAILIRCIYRIPEMTGGWKNPLMRNEVEFMILDGAMISLASILMTVAFPSAHFTSINGNGKKGRAIAKDDCEFDSEELNVLRPPTYPPN